MGETRVDTSAERERRLAFTRALLDDLAALERMLDGDVIRPDVRRVGAEQELFLVDEAMRPARTALAIMDRVQHPQVKPELGLFNLEINLSPHPFTGECLAALERELEELLALLRDAAEAEGTRILLTGILPTLRPSDLTLDAMTPLPRYRQLNAAVIEHRGGPLRLAIRGVDELRLTTDNVMCEACNTSFQVHFQVTPQEFAPLYNLAQAIAGPVLAASANSPVFLQHRLWAETRIAVFEQSVDVRSEAQQQRSAQSRVVFGEQWVEKSVLEIYREDIARYRVLLSGKYDEAPLDALDRGEVPQLEALRLHNGTVYRWNRPCYGILDGKAHLRIEHRSLPSGPSIVDEIGNGALFFGLMTALSEEYPDITQVMSFADAKANFVAAARGGLGARFRWVNGRTVPAEQLLLEELLPAARAGLAAKRLDAGDVDRFLGAVEERVRGHRTGAQWALDSLAQMEGLAGVEERYRALTAAIHANQQTGRPVSEWPLAEVAADQNWRAACRTVEQIMTTDIFTVQADDIVDLAASLMDWKHIRHVPVEEDGRLVGLVSFWRLLRLVARRRTDPVPVREIMITEPITVGPEMSTLDAIDLMRTRRVSCLLVVDGEGKLVGIVTERDVVNLMGRFFHEEFRHE